MKRTKKTACTLALALTLVAGASIGSAKAYFTTFATARGGHPITVDTKSQITEQFSDWTKRIQLSNTGTAQCYVRVKAFAGSEFTLQYTCSDTKWYDGGDGYWYYSEILPVGGSTDPENTLNIKITLPTVTLPDGTPGTPAPDGKDFTEDFNVVVIQECTAVLYREDGTPYADWSSKLVTGGDSYEWEGGEPNE